MAKWMYQVGYGFEESGIQVTGDAWKHKLGNHQHIDIIKAMGLDRT